jgi:hypothetical protein
MSSIRRTMLGTWLAALVALALFGCGDTNPQVTFSADSGGAHPAPGWLPGGHQAAATASLTSCTECHGGDYAGGISKVSCTKCHLGDQQHVHPVAWGELTYAHHATFVGNNGIAGCINAYCHGPSLAGVAGSGPSCTSCHIGGPMAVHPAGITDWMNASGTDFHGTYVDNNGIGSCANLVCHGAILEGVPQSGMSCQSCHTLRW